MVVVLSSDVRGETASGFCGPLMLRVELSVKGVFGSFRKVRAEVFEAVGKLVLADCGTGA